MVQPTVRPKSRSDVLPPYKTPSQASKENYEFLSRELQYGPSRTTVTTSVTPTSSETRPIRRHTQRRPQQEDMVEELKKRYRIRLIPAMKQFRVATTVAGYRMTVDLLQPRNESAYLSLGMRMKNNPFNLKKFVLTPQHSDLRCFTSSMELGCLRLQASLGYDWSRNNFGASWRCKTKWTQGSKLHKCYPVYNSERMELYTFWSIRQDFPQLGGKFTSSSSSFQSDLGRFSLELNRVKAVINI